MIFNDGPQRGRLPLAAGKKPSVYHWQVQSGRRMQLPKYRIMMNYGRKRSWYYVIILLNYVQLMSDGFVFPSNALKCVWPVAGAYLRVRSSRKMYKGVGQLSYRVAQRAFLDRIACQKKWSMNFHEFRSDWKQDNGPGGHNVAELLG